MKARMRARPLERYTRRSSSPVTRKYSARSRSSANALAANTMNASSVTPNTAGIESSANKRSELPIAISTTNSGVATGAVDVREQAALVKGVRDGHDPPCEAHDEVLVDVGILFAMAEELDGRRDEQDAEDEEHERERRDQHRAERDEDRAHDERDEDPE